MNINPQNNASQIYAKNIANQQKAAEAKPATDAKTPTASVDTVEFSALAKLHAEPEVRPDVVAKGKELLNDPNFPSQEMINDIAKLIVPFADDE